MSDSGSELLPSNQLPLEIWHCIFHFLDIPDILRIRRVSRYLNAISHSRNVWSDAYRKAEFVRPPGPNASQSAHDLEYALVPSFLADRALRNSGMAASESEDIHAALKFRKIQYTGVDIGVRLVFGRFLLIAFKDEVRYYDLNLETSDASPGVRIIYRSTDSTLVSFHCITAVDLEGRPIACVVLNARSRTNSPTQETGRTSIYMLKVVGQSELSLNILHHFEYNTVDIEAVYLGPRMLVIHGVTSDDNDRIVVLDIYTRREFRVPSFIREAWNAAKAVGLEAGELLTFGETTWPTGISTTTHLLLTMSFYTRSAGWYTFVQAFTLLHISPSPILSPSHHGMIRGVVIRPDALLHDTIVETSTQDLLITIRADAFRPGSSSHRFRYKYGNLRLGSMRQDKPGPVVFEPLGSFTGNRFPNETVFHPSFDGIGRIFYMYGVNLSAVEFNVRSTDGPGEDDGSGGKIRRYDSVLRFHTLRELLDYDPYSGRMCLSIRSEERRVVEVLDLVVLGQRSNQRDETDDEERRFLSEVRGQLLVLTNALASLSRLLASGA